MKLQVSSSPHIRDLASTRSLMLDVIIALIPAFIASFLLYGLPAVEVTLTTVAASIAAEYFCRRVMKRTQSIGDLSAVVTGLLLAFNMPASVPLYLPVVGAFIAIVVVKQMFGGIGQNFVNPALAARIILTLSFPAAMTAFVVKPAGSSLLAIDLVSTATPLYLLQNSSELPGYLSLFLGTAKGGCLGEVSAIALLIGGIYLIVRRVINPIIPLSYVAVVAAMTAIAGQDPLYHIMSGGLLLGAFFMATDYVTSPLTLKGKLIFGIGCGLLTGLIRLFGGMTEGVSFSIVLMNILVPHLDRWTRPVPFGGVSHAKK
ncbi:MAG TPA: Na+-transporting NADH:ubiquinone oxidoreductase subunit D [Clostridiales bacterium]|nr:Na+-transporting NADH:ubiquinone oxidoreductase subunit D [Clostridiales bacterium]